MKTFYYFGPNDDNVSGVSWKMWQIERKGCVVTARWGRATIVKHKLAPAGNLQTESWSLPTAADAKEYEAGRIQEKLDKGYEQR